MYPLSGLGEAISVDHAYSGLTCWGKRVKIALYQAKINKTKYQLDIEKVYFTLDSYDTTIPAMFENSIHRS
jgi:hypothetical protein